MAAVRILGALLSIAVLVGVGYGWTLGRRLTEPTVTSDALGPLADLPDGEPFTALVVGIDARTDAAGRPLPQPLLDALHAGPDQGQLNTDTIILLHVPGRAGGPATAISIPRDSYVTIAGEYGKHKINSAYDRGFVEAKATLSARGVTGSALEQQAREAGRQKLIATVDNLTGLTVDHYAELNLVGFVELSEAVGGVPVCLSRPAQDNYSGIDLPAGEQSVLGPQALAFVRQRHGLERGDLDRIARQQAFAAGLAVQLQRAGTLTNPDRLGRLINVINRYVVLDRSWNLGQAIAQVRLFTGGNLIFRTIPTGRPDLDTPADGMAVQIDKAAVRRFVAAALGLPPPPATPPDPVEAPETTYRSTPDGAETDRDSSGRDHRNRDEADQDETDRALGADPAGATSNRVVLAANGTGHRTRLFIAAVANPVPPGSPAPPENPVPPVNSAPPGNSGPPTTPVDAPPPPGGPTTTPADGSVAATAGVLPSAVQPTPVITAGGIPCVN